MYVACARSCYIVLYDGIRCYFDVLSMSHYVTLEMF